MHGLPAYRSWPIGFVNTFRAQRAQAHRAGEFSPLPNRLIRQHFPLRYGRYHAVVVDDLLKPTFVVLAHRTKSDTGTNNAGVVVFDCVPCAFEEHRASVAQFTRPILHDIGAGSALVVQVFGDVQFGVSPATQRVHHPIAGVCCHEFLSVREFPCGAAQSASHPCPVAEVATGSTAGEFLLRIAFCAQPFGFVRVFVGAAGELACDPVVHSVSRHERTRPTM